MSRFSKWFGAVGTVALVLVAGIAGAQTQESVNLQPALIEEAVSPGQTFTSKVQVTNLTGAAKTFYFLVRDVQSVDQGQPAFAPVGTFLDTGLAAWVRIPRPSLLIQAGETREVSFSVVVPENAFPGGHYGAIFASSEPGQVSEPGTGSAVGYQVGTLLNLRLAGTAVEEARIREFRTEKRVVSSGDVRFTTKVENLGNVLVRPRGPLEIENMFGKKVATLKMNDEGAGIFPKSDRDFQTVWSPAGLAFGRYQATLALTYGEDGKKTITSSVALWILPLGIILPVVGGLLLVLGGGYFLLRWYIRRKLRELGGPAAASAGRAPVSRLLFVTVATLTFVLIFLVALFVFFS